ncbi:hypothetical protein SASPL_144288 [Salvia splendens]|uniref:Retrovirus-related Pol polyprotein from transposon RE1 n=1 Tax=Salvia splendens TaxID=180675 RepID=A0A8X8WGU6_SALSN|nr:hypothetical protein SASPL_144288 [Salvia splendens]
MNKVIVSRDVTFFEDKKWEETGDEKEINEVPEVAALESKNEQNGDVEAELLIEESIDHEPVRGTKSLGEIYARCNVALIEPVTGDEESEIQKLKDGLMKEFEMTDLGKMAYLLGMEVHQKKGDIFYKEKLSRGSEQESELASEYKKMVGCLMYLTATRPDIQHVVSILSRFLHCANEEHLTAAKRVLRYLKGTQGYGVRFMEVQEMKLVGYVDSDWGGSAEDMKSTTEVQQDDEVKLRYCKTEDQIADVFTKPLAVSRFNQLIHEVGVC